MPKDLITMRDAADLRGCTIGAISKLVSRGRITGYPQYGKTLVSRSEVEKYMPVKPGPKPSGTDGKVNVKSSKKPRRRTKQERQLKTLS
jgi:hypothetical protein